MAMRAAYRDDFYSWAREQAQILRSAKTSRFNGPAGIDWANLAEEIESLGISQERELFSRYRVILIHLLKLRYQPKKRTPSWPRTIRMQRDEIYSLLKRNPGLKPRRRDELAEAYLRAREAAAEETHEPLELFPETCPFTIDRVEDPDFWPEPTERGA